MARAVENLCRHCDVFSVEIDSLKKKKRKRAAKNADREPLNATRLWDLFLHCCCLVQNKGLRLRKGRWLYRWGGGGGVMYEYFIGTLALYQMPKCKLSKTGATSLTLLSMQSPPAGTLDIYRHALRICTGSFRGLHSPRASTSALGHPGFITAKRQSSELLGPSGGAAACKRRQQDG